MDVQQMTHVWTASPIDLTRLVRWLPTDTLFWHTSQFERCDLDCLGIELAVSRSDDKDAHLSCQSVTLLPVTCCLSELPPFLCVDVSRVVVAYTGTAFSVREFRRAFDETTGIRDKYVYVLCSGGASAVSTACTQHRHQVCFGAVKYNVARQVNGLMGVAF